MTDRYLVTADEIEALHGEEKQHFLNPNGLRIQKSLGDLTGLTAFGFNIIEVPPGKDSTEYHVHRFEDECVYVLSGHGEVTIGEEVLPVAAGDFVGYRAGGLPHCMRNSGEDTLRCIVVGTRPPHDVCDYPRLGKRLYSDAGQPWEMVDVEDIALP